MVDDPYERVANRDPHELSLDDLVLAARANEDEVKDRARADALIAEARARASLRSSDPEALLTLGQVIYHGFEAGEVPDELRITAQAALHRALTMRPDMGGARAYLVHFAHEAGEHVQCISLARSVNRESYRDLGVDELLMRIDEHVFDAMCSLGLGGGPLADVFDQVVDSCRRTMKVDGFLVREPNLFVDRARTAIDAGLLPAYRRTEFLAALDEIEDM